MTRTIRPRPLTSEAFAPYGDVIEATDVVEQREINEGFTRRFHDLADINVTSDNGKPGVSIFRSRPRTMPLTLAMMERHPKSSQAFIPLGDSPYIVAVAPAGNLDPANIEVFLASSDQGVNYRAGTWHHYSLALDAQSDFLVVDRIANDENCDEVALQQTDQICIDLSDIL